MRETRLEKNVYMLPFIKGKARLNEDFSTSRAERGKEGTPEGLAKVVGPQNTRSWWLYYAFNWWTKRTTGIYVG
jgi:hypothetical protein